MFSNTLFQVSALEKVFSLYVKTLVTVQRLIDLGAVYSASHLGTSRAYTIDPRGLCLILGLLSMHPALRTLKLFLL